MTLFEGEGRKPDGLISTDDMMTRGILAGLRKLGLQVGRDIQLASHVNKGSTVLHGEEGEMIFVEVDPAGIVQQMFAQLETLMAGVMPAEAHLYVPARLQP
jgi:DNA-binding LacI/PurR family transcriptional regulator